MTAKPWGSYFGHAARRCNECGRSFYPKQGWEQTCYPCWKASQDQVESPPSGQAATLRDKERELYDFEADLFEFAKELTTRERRIERREQSHLEEVGRWQSMIMPLIRLAHLDRHGGSREANDVTRWLLEQRERMRGG